MVVSCKLCGSKNTRSLTLNRHYHHCEDCHFIFLDERELISEKEERKRYLQHHNSMENAGYVHMFQRFIDKALEPQYTSAQRLFDFGCGPNPVFAQIMKENGKNVDFYDPYFFPSNDYLQKQYDIITLTEVIEHIQYPVQILQRLKGCLRSFGMIAVMTKFHPGIEYFDTWWYRKDNTHISFFSEKSIGTLAKSLEMTLTKTDHEQFFCLQMINNPTET